MQSQMECKKDSSSDNLNKTYTYYEDRVFSVDTVNVSGFKYNMSRTGIGIFDGFMLDTDYDYVEKIINLDNTNINISIKGDDKTRELLYSKRQFVKGDTYTPSIWHLYFYNDSLKTYKKIFGYGGPNGYDFNAIKQDLMNELGHSYLHLKSNSCTVYIWKFENLTVTYGSDSNDSKFISVTDNAEYERVTKSVSVDSSQKAPIPVYMHDEMERVSGEYLKNFEPVLIPYVGDIKDIILEQKESYEVSEPENQRVPYSRKSFSSQKITDVFIPVVFLVLFIILFLYLISTNIKKKNEYKANEERAKQQAHERWLKKKEEEELMNQSKKVLYESQLLMYKLELPGYLEKVAKLNKEIEQAVKDAFHNKSNLKNERSLRQAYRIDGKEFPSHDELVRLADESEQKVQNYMREIKLVIADCPKTPIDPQIPGYKCEEVEPCTPCSVVEWYNKFSVNYLLSKPAQKVLLGKTVDQWIAEAEAEEERFYEELDAETDAFIEELAFSDDEDDFDDDFEDSSSYTSSSSSSRSSRSSRSSSRSRSTNSLDDFNDGYEAGRMAALIGDQTGYMRGVGGSESYQNGYRRGYEQNVED